MGKNKRLFEVLTMLLAMPLSTSLRPPLLPCTSPLQYDYIRPGSRRLQTRRLAQPPRTSSSFVCDVYDAVAPSLVRIDTIGPRGSRLGTGTGIIVDAEAGLVVTNAHVAAVSRSTHLCLFDGRNFTAICIGRSKELDVAVLHIEENEGTHKTLGSERLVTSAPIGEAADLRVGQYAVALGYAGGNVGLTATLGIVSGLNQSVQTTNEAVSSPDYILTDAAYNRGVSGGPLCDEWGYVVGMNTFQRMDIPSIGFAISIERVMEQVSEIAANRERAVGSTSAALYLYNDPMNKRARVEAVLQEVFRWSKEEANKVMMQAHTKGRALCGEWSTAETERLASALAVNELLCEIIPCLPDTHSEAL